MNVSLSIALNPYPSLNSSSVYLPGLVGYNEDFMRDGNEIIVGGEFPCDEDGNPIMEWIGVKVENAAYIHCKGDFNHYGLFFYEFLYRVNIQNVH